MNAVKIISRKTHMFADLVDLHILAVSFHQDEDMKTLIRKLISIAWLRGLSVGFDPDCTEPIAEASRELIEDMKAFHGLNMYDELRHRCFIERRMGQTIIFGKMKRLEMGGLQIIVASKQELVSMMLDKEIK